MAYDSTCNQLIRKIYNKKSGAHRSSYHYGYSPDGNQSRKIAKVSGKADKITDYTYDRLGRLTEEKEQNGNTVKYEYDRFSNRSKMTLTDTAGKNIVTTYVYDLRNRLQTETKVDSKNVEEILSYRYDWNGNQVHRQWERFSPKKEPKVPGRVGFYASKFCEDIVVLEMREYNGFNELSYLYRDTLETRYTYRPDGLRHRKTFADGTAATHIWDGQDIVAEYGANGSVHSRYLRGLNLIASDRDNQLQYFIYNAHGDVVERTDQNGTTLKNYDYDAFGVEQNPEILDSNPWRYCGEYFDREADTVYLRARDYDAKTGRFISEDPICDALNWYAYCSGNPIALIDPSGLAPKWVEDWLKRVRETKLMEYISILTQSGEIDELLSLLGFDRDNNSIFHVQQDSWQKHWGYNDFYDWGFDAATDMKVAKFPFACGDQNYVLWAWKGDYINLGAGAEMGIYYGGGPHWLVDTELAMPMTLTLLDQSGNTIFNWAPDEANWWITGFDPDLQGVFAELLTAIYTINFSQNQDMFFELYDRWFDDKRWYFDFDHYTATFTF